MSRRHSDQLRSVETRNGQKRGSNIFLVLRTVCRNRVPTLSSTTHVTGYRVRCSLEDSPAWVCNEKYRPALTTLKVEGHATRDPPRATLQHEENN